MIVKIGTVMTKIWNGRTCMDDSKCKDYECICWTPWAQDCAICAMTNALIEAELRQDEVIKEENK